MTWVVIGPKERRGAHWYAECRCSCGVVQSVRVQIRSGAPRSLGCQACANTLRARHVRHGHSRKRAATQAYRAWKHLVERCTNPRVRNYADYGGRGIAVCHRWLASFENFLVDMGEPPSRLHSIDRIDNEGHYEPENCRWATRVEQGGNKRNNVRLELDGTTKTLAQWARSTGLLESVIRGRLRHGWSVERALTTRPLRRDEWISRGQRRT